MSSTNLKVILSAVDKLSPALKKIKRISGLTSKSLRDIGRAGSQLTRAIGTTALVGFTAAVGGLWKVLGVNREFERFQTILETIEGSSEKAKQSMDWVQNFAIKTPYELAEVTDAFVKLKAYGIDPTNGALASAGDAGAAMGKSVNQAVEALADAMTGENERLKEFGIKAQKQGDKITYNWNQNGKQMRKTADANSAAQIEAVITGIWNSRYGGAMDKLAGTFDGMWSNMKDTVAKFAKGIGDAGAFDSLKYQMSGVLSLMNLWAEDGTLDEVAKLISGVLTDAVSGLIDTLREVDMVEVVKGFGETLKSINETIKSLGGLKNIAIGLGVALAAGPVSALLSIVGVLFRFGSGLIAILGGWSAIGAGIMKVVGVARMFLGFLPLIGKAILFIGRALMLTPLGIVFSLVTAAVLVYKNWDKVKEWFSSFGTWISDKVKGIAKTLKGLMPDWLKSFATQGGKVSVNADAPATTNRTNILNAGNQNLKGDIAVRFENAPPGMRVGQAKTNQSGVKVNPNVGYRFNGDAL